MRRTVQRDIFPVPAFRVLLETVMQKTADCSAVFFVPSEIPQARGVLELVETRENSSQRSRGLRVSP